MPTLRLSQFVTSRVLPAALAAICPAFLMGGCGSPRSATSAPAAATQTENSLPSTPAIVDATASSSADVAAPATPPAPRCPDGMVHVKHDFCPEMKRECTKKQYDPSNHITICHRFAEGKQRCLADRVALDYCIDRYEFPNAAGGHPPVMVDWYEAMGACANEGKRLCYESEWVAACEGPDETPFPYGWERSKKMCNIDNPWVSPRLKRIYSRDKAVREKELARLDQSVPSGSMQTCQSGYGVFDLTGNFDEWALADHDRPKKRADFAALKGGAWGHVRNACRPVTTSHRPEFTYYFVSFRCCSDLLASEGSAAPADPRPGDTQPRP